MAEPTTRGQSDMSRASLGDLVALAVSDLSQLVKCEVDLAKQELKQDARRLGAGGALLGVAAFAGCLVLVLLCFAYAYGLQAAGIWPWAAFLIAGGAIAIGFAKFRGLSGLRRTRSTVSGDLALIRRDGGAPTARLPGKS